MDKILDFFDGHLPKTDETLFRANSRMMLASILLMIGRQDSVSALFLDLSEVLIVTSIAVVIFGELGFSLLRKNGRR